MPYSYPHIVNAHFSGSTVVVSARRAKRDSIECAWAESETVILMENGLTCSIYDHEIAQTGCLIVDKMDSVPSGII